MKTAETTLSEYLQAIAERITIDFPTVSGLSPYITKQTFKYLSIAYNSRQSDPPKHGGFHVSTKGLWLNPEKSIEMAQELNEASMIVKNLNHLYNGK